MKTTPQTSSPTALSKQTQTVSTERRTSPIGPPRSNTPLPISQVFGWHDMFGDFRSQLVQPTSPKSTLTPNTTPKFSYSQVVKRDTSPSTVSQPTRPTFHATSGLLSGQDVRLKTGAAKGIKLEVGAGDFSTDRKPTDFYKNHGGDVITELIKGKSDGWGTSQQTNMQSLRQRGAHVFTGVDATNLQGAMGTLFGSNAPRLRKLKIENPALPKTKKGDKGLAYTDIFSSADPVLEKGGVIEWGLTGPLERARKTLAPVVKAAHKKGFELVEVRTKTAKSHTFSQETTGMHDKHLTQYVFARSKESTGVRQYVTKQMQSKGTVTAGQVAYGETSDRKTRSLITTRGSKELSYRTPRKKF